jgi:hypothetical protein
MSSVPPPDKHTGQQVTPIQYEELTRQQYINQLTPDEQTRFNKLSPMQQFMEQMTPQDKKMFWNNIEMVIANQITKDQKKMTAEHEKEKRAIDDPGALNDVD